ncbi:hypothetical protein [Paenibacillus xylanilyticus]|uniref:hypothetical protein n=1 Tax=Paenibacillus xylanilyticus TaxID=248903 RepID=UPI0039A1BA26
MGAYVMEVHEGMLQTAVPIKYVDVEIAFVGDDGADVYVGGISPTCGELYRHIFHIGAESTGSSRNHIIHNLNVSSSMWELRIISNKSRPYHLAVRVYCRSADGQTLGVLSEHQMIKLAD